MAYDRQADIATCTAALEARDGARSTTEGCSVPCLVTKHKGTARIGWNRTTGLWRCANCGESGGVVGMAGLLGLTLSNGRARSGKPGKGKPAEPGRSPRTVVKVTRYEIRNVDGELQAVHVRTDFSDGSKSMPWPGGTKPAELPFYLSERLNGLTPGTTVVINEGEKAAHALDEIGVIAVGTVTGAQSIPNDAVLLTVVQFDIVLFADNDNDGRNHMVRIAARLVALGAKSVRLLSWPEAPEKGDAADLIEICGNDAGPKLAELLAAAPPYDPADGDASGKVSSDAARAETTIVIIGSDEHRVNDESLDALVADPGIYARAGRLVRVAAASVSATAQIQELPQPSIRELLSKRVNYRKQLADGDMHDAHPPDWTVTAIANRGNYPNARTLAAVISSPTLRPDGTILSEAGYDPATHLLLHQTGDVPLPDDEPTLQDACDAADELLEVVADFPFETPEHRSAWLAFALTFSARHMDLGDVPLIYVEANTPGTGKGLVIDAATLIGTGRQIARSPQPTDDAEMGKQILSVAIAGTPAVLFDNCTGKFAFRSLDAALTCNGTWSDRVLGSNRRPELPLRTQFALTGNNVALGSDTCRRALYIRLCSDLENPEDRTDFQHADLLGWIAKERPRLAKACLTILRAYVVAGQPRAEPPLAAWGSFERWSGLIRQAVVWTGQPDPWLARKELRNRADVDRASLIALFEFIAMTPAGLTVVELIEGAKSDPEVQATLCELCPPARGSDVPTSRQVGYRLRACCDRVIDGRRLEATKAGGGKNRWRIISATTKEPSQPPDSAKAAGQSCDGGDGGDVSPVGGEKHPPEEGEADDRGDKDALYPRTPDPDDDVPDPWTSDPDDALADGGDTAPVEGDPLPAHEPPARGAFAAPTVPPGTPDHKAVARLMQDWPLERRRDWSFRASELDRLHWMLSADDAGRLAYLELVSELRL